MIGYEIGRILKKETIFCERVNGKFVLRRGFHIKKGSKVLIVEDVITTGKSSLECVRLIKKGGIIVLDNMLWDGEVIQPKDKQAKVLFETNEYIQKDKRVSNFLAPIRDGLMVCIKK